jgi:hypothetical protein
VRAYLPCSGGNVVRWPPDYSAALRASGPSPSSSQVYFVTPSAADQNFSEAGLRVRIRFPPAASHERTVGRAVLASDVMPHFA